MTDDLNKAIKLAEAASEQLQKSHVKQYTRRDGTVVKEHDDSRMSKEELLAHADHHLQEAAKTNNTKTDTPKAKWHKGQAEKYQRMAAEHDTSTQKNTTLASLKKHPMWSESDFQYFKGKGYSHDEIKDIWDRDHKMGKEPLVHKKAPDVVGVIADPNHNKGGAHAEHDDKPARQFKKGDKAKDEYGKTHTVIEQRGNSVKTAQSGSNWIHASKLWHHQG